MTTREFLEMAGYKVNSETLFVVNSETLFVLSEYVAGNIDYSQFPDADVVTQDGILLIECAEEPAQFQEWMDRFWYKISEKVN